MSTKLSDIIGPEYTKLGFFREAQEKMAELETYNVELELKKQEIQDILNGIQDILAVVSPDYHIIYTNSIFHRYFHVTNPEGMYCYKVFRNRLGPCVDCPLRTAFNTGKLERISRIDTNSNGATHFEVSAAPIFDDKGRVRNVLIAKRDVTLEKEYQSKYLQAEKMATIGLLAAGVAHEINNPLTAISGFSEALGRHMSRLRLLAREDADQNMLDDFSEYVNIIRKECDRCRDIVGSLLSFSSKKSTKRDTLDLNVLVRDTLRMLQHQIKLRPGITLVEHLHPEPIIIQGAQGELKQVLLNLVLNAMDAIEAEGTITISTRQEAQALLIVEDTGQGIDRSGLEKLFVPFFTTKTKGHSIGIGLSICYNVVQNHGGEIRVCSELGKGSIFRVILPVFHPTGDHP